MSDKKSQTSGSEYGEYESLGHRQSIELESGTNTETEEKIETDYEDEVDEDYKTFYKRKKHDQAWLLRNMEIVAENVDKVLLLVSQLAERIEELEENRKRPTGCGFSCSNNSFTM